MPRHVAALLLSVGLMAGCTTAAAPLAMARALGTIQCETGGPTAESLAQALRDAGIPVAAVGCGHDGRMRPAVCGAPDGRLAIVEIPADRRTQAEALGWRPLSDLPDASRQPC